MAASRATKTKSSKKTPRKKKPTKKDEKVETILARTVKALVLKLQMDNADEEIKKDIAEWWNPDSIRLFKRLDVWADYVKKLAETIDDLKADGRLQPWVFSVPATAGLQTTFSGIVWSWLYSEIPSGDTGRRKLTKAVEDMIDSRIGLYARMIAK